LCYPLLDRSNLELMYSSVNKQLFQLESQLVMME
jgi:hypothetical protein